MGPTPASREDAVAPVRVAVLPETLQGADGSVRRHRVGATAVRRHRVGATASRRLLLLADIDLHALAGALRAARDDDLQDAIVVRRLQVLGVHV